MTLAERIAQHDAWPDPNGRDNCAQCGRPIRHDATDLRPTVRGTLYRYAHDDPRPGWVARMAQNAKELER